MKTFIFNFIHPHVYPKLAVEISEQTYTYIYM